MPIYQSRPIRSHSAAKLVLLPQTCAEFPCWPARRLAFKILIARRFSAQMADFPVPEWVFSLPSGNTERSPLAAPLVIEGALGHSEGDAAACGDHSGPRSRRRR